MQTATIKNYNLDISSYEIIKWVFGTFMGIFGAILVSLNFEYSKYGYVLFTISSFAWVYISISKKDNALLFMQLVFTVINIIGLYQWILV